MSHLPQNPKIQGWPRHTKPNKDEFMNFSQGHSGTKVQCELCLVSDQFFTQISGRNFLPELFGEVHPKTAPLSSSVLCPSIYRKEHLFDGEKRAKRCREKRRKRGGQERGQKKRKKGCVKTGQVFPRKNTRIYKMGENHEFFVLTLFLVWFAGATPEGFQGKHLRIVGKY